MQMFERKAVIRTNKYCAAHYSSNHYCVALIEKFKYTIKYARSTIENCVPHYPRNHNCVVLIENCKHTIGTVPYVIVLPVEKN